MNLAHGSVRCGKTVGTAFRFLQAVENCPDSQIWMIGHTSETIYHNVIRPIMESPVFALFRPFCAWHPGKRQLTFRDKIIHTIGAKDEGAIGAIQGKTFSLVYCDEMTLYPESIIDMIDTRLSMPYSIGIATMNPSHPGHKLKQWIDKAEAGDKNYYSLHFTLDDNPYVDDDYRQRVGSSLAGLAYKRLYLGEWCQAEGAVFDFFDPVIYVVSKPRTAAEYWIAGIDWGTHNPTACVLIGVNTGRANQQGKQLWVEREYYWDSIKKDRQKTIGELADDLYEFLEPYALRGIYVDPSAAAFKLELSRRGLHCIDAYNDVLDGIGIMTSEMARGNLLVCNTCPNMIREIQSYMWDRKKAEKGEDAPVKKDDHLVDALRYAIATHKVPTYKPYDKNNDEGVSLNNRQNLPIPRIPGGKSAFF